MGKFEKALVFLNMIDLDYDSKDEEYSVDYVDDFIETVKEMPMNQKDRDMIIRFVIDVKVCLSDVDTSTKEFNRTVNEMVNFTNNRKAIETLRYKIERMIEVENTK